MIIAFNFYWKCQNDVLQLASGQVTRQQRDSASNHQVVVFFSIRYELNNKDSNACAPTAHLRYKRRILLNRGGARHFHLGGPLEEPVLQQGELPMVCVGLSERDLKNFWGAQAKFLGGSGPPGTPLAPPLLLNMRDSTGLAIKFKLCNLKLRNSGYFAESKNARLPRIFCSNCAQLNLRKRTTSADVSMQKAFE